MIRNTDVVCKRLMLDCATIVLRRMVRVDVATQQVAIGSPIANNLTQLMLQQNVSMVELAKALDLPVMTVRRIVLGETKDPRISTLKQLAEYFDVSLDSLLNKSESPNSEQPNLPICWLPIVSWECLRRQPTLDGFAVADAKVWQPVTLYQKQALSARAFILPSLPHLHHRFPAGTLFVVDPEVAAKDGDLLVLLMEGEPAIKTLQVDPPNWWLQPLSQRGETIALDRNHHRVVGVVMLSLLFNQRLVREL